MAQKTIGDLFKHINSTLANTLGESEARSAAKVILEDVRGVTPTDLIVNSHRTVEPETEARIEDIVNRVIAGEPIQYAIGSAHFYGMDFKVAPGVLIPRPETEGLVDLIIDQYAGQRDMKILDCGTGSGCIAIALARNLPFADVTAIDVSQRALDIASENGQRFKVSVDFRIGDIFSLSATDQGIYDLIVSNPPYIVSDEAADMDHRVLDYEPRDALFVSDSDPLEFYRAIAKYGQHALKSGGRVYFELNPRFAVELRHLLIDLGYSDPTIIRDYIGRNRFAIASKT